MIPSLFEWVNNDDINQSANATNQQNNVDSPTRKLKKRWQKNVGLTLQNMKPCIFAMDAKAF
jgi:hypothetical protein